MTDTIYNTPEYCFALTPDVESKNSFTLDNKVISPESFLPTRTRSKDTGYDVRCAEPDGLELRPGCYFKMRLGFRMFAPDGWWMTLAPRSSTFISSHVHALYGIIDEAFEMEMCFVGQYVPDECQIIPADFKLIIPYGQRFAQIMPVLRLNMPVKQISNQEYDFKCKIRNDPRGAQGFGSSGPV